jgi:hypothetical protein
MPERVEGIVEGTGGSGGKAPRLESGQQGVHRLRRDGRISTTHQPVPALRAPEAKGEDEELNFVILKIHLGTRG